MYSRTFPQLPINGRAVCLARLGYSSTLFARNDWLLWWLSTFFFYFLKSWPCFLFSSPMELDSYRILLLPQCNVVYKWEVKRSVLATQPPVASILGTGYQQAGAVGADYTWQVGWSWRVHRFLWCADLSHSSGSVLWGCDCLLGTWHMGKQAEPTV